MPDAKVPPEVRALALKTLAEGRERGEDRRRWTIELIDDDDNLVKVMSLADAAGVASPVVLH